MSTAPDPAPQSWSRRLAAGIAVGALVGTIVGLAIVQRGGTTYRDALTVATDAGALAVDASDSAVALTATLTDLADVLTDQIASLRELTTTAADLSETLGTAAQTNIAESVRGAADVADRLARALEITEFLIPGNSDSLAEDLREISDGLDPIPDQLRLFGDQLITGAADLRRIERALAGLESEVAALGARIDTAAGALEELPDTTAALVANVEAARDRAALDLWLLRIAVVLLGALTAAIGVALWQLSPRLAGRRNDPPSTQPVGPT